MTMVRRRHLYENLFGLSKNPFPDHAVASAGTQEHPFYEHLYPGILRKMARAFICDDHGRFPTVAFLWSLGEGEEARGYGKTRHLLWLADYVNQDQGLRVMRLADGNPESCRLIASVATFNEADGLSLSDLLFDAVSDLVRNRRECLVALQGNNVKKGQTKEEIYQSARDLIRIGGEEWFPPLLHRLCYARPEEWAQYINNRWEFRRWHRARYGRQLFRSIVAFLTAAGISRVLVLVDQVEDFARWTTPKYKLRRDLARFSYLCTADKILRDRVTFVLTMHPQAARILSWYWPDELGPVSHDSDRMNVVLLGRMGEDRFVEMVKRYLEQARVRAVTDPLRPFTPQALHYVYEIDRGRPGYCLQRLHRLLEAAGDERMSLIDGGGVVKLVGDVREMVR